MALSTEIRSMTSFRHHCKPIVPFVLSGRIGWRISAICNRCRQRVSLGSVSHLSDKPCCHSKKPFKGFFSKGTMTGKMSLFFIVGTFNAHQSRYNIFCHSLATSNDGCFIDHLIDISCLSITKSMRSMNPFAKSVHLWRVRKGCVFA